MCVHSPVCGLPQTRAPKPIVPSSSPRAPPCAATMYRVVKRLCDVKYGIITQCLLREKANIGLDRYGQPGKLPSGTYLANVAVEVNAKLGGVDRKLFGKGTHMLPVVGGAPFMVMGIDVSMPVSNNMHVPTVGAVVGSMDR